MVKKSVIFFSFFAVIMIGGALVLSFWVLPKYAISNSAYDIQVSKAEMINPQTTEIVSNTHYGSQDATQVSQGYKMTQIIIVFLAIYIVLLFGVKLKNTYAPDKPDSMPAYLFKISRLTGKSEYDIFFKAAEDWPVSLAQVEQDFDRYLTHLQIPYYVNDFVRKNKEHIDELHISPF
jgi:hypothetical protein